MKNEIQSDTSSVLILEVRDLKTDKVLSLDFMHSDIETPSIDEIMAYDLGRFTGFFFDRFIGKLGKDITDDISMFGESHITIALKNKMFDKVLKTFDIKLTASCR